ncbi:MAG: T9SS type A sorting domain-containing protein [Saprospiraceae bacterium]|nr:T9SS type A sorting domain-containing protein [Saprospiraceae bacterium]
MHKFFTTAIAVFAFAFASQAQSNILLYADTLHKEAPADQFEIDIANYVYNLSGQTVTFKWTRTLEQPFPNGWVTNFCDNNLCYLGQTGTAQFELAASDTGLLKPVFYPYETPGTGIYRLKLESLTASVPFQADILYVATATSVSSGVSVVELRDGAAIFPNPASETLNVVFVNPDFKGMFRITDASGRVIQTHTAMSAQEALDITTLPAGFYSLQAWNESGQLVLSKPFSRQ